MKKKTSKNSFVIMLAFVVVLGYLLSGGPLSHKYTPQQTNTQYILVSETPYPNHQTLQLKTLHFITATPVPTLPSLCQQGGINEEPFILIGYLPAQGQSVSAGGQIKVWVSDESPPIVAPGEKADPTSGLITTIGDRTAKAPDNFLWEPALYISPQTAESGGTPHFPNYIKGSYTSGPNGSTFNGPAIDTVPPGPPPKEPDYKDEYLWDVNSLGLTSGTYQAEFVIHDGDENRGIGCVTITIQ